MQPYGTTHPVVSLRDYQNSVVKDIRQELKNGVRTIIVVLSTGSGKTVIFSYIAHSGSQKGTKFLIVAHRDALIKQASAKLRDYGVRHGIIMAGYTPTPGALAQVASIQTIVRRLKSLRFVPDVIVIDEAHLSAAKSYRLLVDHFPNAKIIGFTGSPCRLDNKPLGIEYGGIFEKMVRGISMKGLIADGYLLQPVVYAPKLQLDLSGVKTSKGDYDQEQLAAVVDKPKIIGSAVEHYKEICNGAPAVAWCVTVAHATHVAEQFNEAGIKAVMLCGEHKTDYRDKVMGQLSNGEVKVVTFVGILVEGVDCPPIAVVILLRPTLSLASYLQVIGRSLRPLYTPGMDLSSREGRFAAIACSGKTRSTVLDHAGLVWKHGFADDDRDWSLDHEVRRKKKKKTDEDEEIPLRQCPKCYLVHAPAPICPGCGHVYELVKQKLDHGEGQLVEVTPEMVAQNKEILHKEVKQAKSLPDLQRIAAERGYSEKWAQHTFESRKRARDKHIANAIAKLHHL